MDDHKVLTDGYGALLAEGKYDKFRGQYLTLHPYDQSQIYMQLNREERTIVSYYLSPEEMAEIMGNLLDETELLEDALSDMDPNYAASVIADMYTDDAVDLLENLEKEQTISYLMLMDKDRAEPIRHLLHYEDSTAGSIMTTEYIGVSENQTVRDAMQMLRKEALDAELIYYIYVVDHQNKLTGVISLRDLLVAADDTWIFELMNEQVHYAKVSDDQETVARMMRDYDFLALPVVDFQLHMVGIITVDDIMDVMDEIASDDYSKLAGVSEMEKLDTNPLSSARKRLPWLIILLFLGLITANLISHFESALSQKAILAVFIPLIAGMAGNTGTQSLAVIVRGIATGEIAEENKWLLLLREAGTGLITGVTCGILVTILVFAWQDDLFLAILVGNSILVSLMVATLAGSLVPLVMNKLKIDPAVASGPFITTINDLISIVIYFGMATIFMSRLG
ncbi:magnesium transporter MgtE [Bacillus sp. FJAT-27916]|uniref:magnesium transporter n=1 Tax=Bacillus sp. FJAT-27916 TaxID=1679169 RepID=UPI000670CE52|nr:magnesium transporter [Bacillus sp. FJAT-27916]KMY45322.1 magnesium transporter MgtE [Bacillus sp. FJAT-27916]